jgi:hypothetical protein
MVCERFIGSGRLQEGGFLGTHKQDFEAHRKGCDWRHDATQIDMSPIISAFPGLNVQETLELISTAMAGDIGLPTVLQVNNHAGSNPISMDMQFIHELQNPVQPQDAATKWYVDQAVSTEQNWKTILEFGNFSGGVDVDINQGSEIKNSDPGGGFTVSLTDNPTGNCSSFTFNGADGYVGSDFIVFLGDSTNGLGGGINLRAGNSTTLGGNINIQGGSGLDYGGNSSLRGGSGSNYGGNIYIQGGFGPNIAGGNITITAGSSTTGTGGDITLTTSNSTIGISSITIDSDIGINLKTMDIGLDAMNITLNAGVALIWPHTDGLSGQAMMTDGLGNLSWGTFLSGAQDHGSLTGLTNDDHLQYLNRSGVRAMLGDLSMGSNDISDCLSVRAPIGQSITVGSEESVHSYNLETGTSSYIVTYCATNVYKDQYYNTIEYSRNGGTLVLSDIPAGAIIRWVNNGKSYIAARHWGGGTGYVIQTDVNYS